MSGAETRRPGPAGPGAVLAVVGGTLDEMVLDLALVLACQEGQPLHLVQIVEVSLALPMLAYGKLLRDQHADGPLESAWRRCGDRAVDGAVVLCRSMGPALVTEAAERGCTDLVLGAPTGNWWARGRQGRAFAYLRARAGCRVFVVHAPAARGQQPAAALAR